jgi:SET domain-containing protein
MPKQSSQEQSSPSIHAHVETRISGVHGLGVFALHALPAGTIIGLYEGQRYTPDEVEQGEWDSRLTYLFALSDGAVIDGAKGGNATRHLNHACEPNCEAVEYQDERGELAVRIETTRRVQQGEELFLDYALIIDEAEDPADYPCCCGTPACRGTMAAKPVN